MANRSSITQSDFYVYALFRNTGVPFYIGKGRKDRWRCHEWHARNGAKGHKYAIIRSLFRRGFDLIRVKLHECLTEAIAHEYEIALIRAIGRGKDGPLVNLTDGGDGLAGFKHSLDSIEKTASAHRGKKRSPETRAKNSAAQRGKKLTPEHIAKISATTKGRKWSHARLNSLTPESIEKSAAAQRGKIIPPEVRAKMSAALRGRKHSPEHIAKIAKALSGRIMPLEEKERLSVAMRNSKAASDHRKKLTETQRGKPLTEEHRAKIAAGLRAFNERIQITPLAALAPASMRSRVDSRHE